jgi:hypothetical protein
MNYIEALKNNQMYKEEFFSEAVAQMVDQIDVLDPVDDADEFLDLLETALENKAANRILCFLLGVSDLEEWIEDTVNIDG